MGLTDDVDWQWEINRQLTAADLTRELMGQLTADEW